jgi:hypothetical protein
MRGWFDMQHCRRLSGDSQEGELPASSPVFRKFYRARQGRSRHRAFGDLRHVTNEDNKYTMLSYFNKADPDLGARQIRVLNADGSKVKTMSEKLSDE